VYSVRDGDIVLDYGLIPPFQQLERCRGGPATLRVVEGGDVEGGDGPPVSRRAVRTVTIPVPAATEGR